MPKNVALTKDNHDIFFENGQLAMVKDIDNVEQKLKSRLSTFSSEWFLNTLIGLPFFDEILIKNPNVPDIDSLIKVEIVNTVGVTELIEFGSDFDVATRTYSATFKVLTEFGELEFSETVFNGETL